MENDDLGYVWSSPVTVVSCWPSPINRGRPAASAATASDGSRGGLRRSTTSSSRRPTPIGCHRWPPRRGGLRRRSAVSQLRIGWERPLQDDLRATLANMTAWNRWISELIVDGHGRLHPVGHVSLRDPAWLTSQLMKLAGAGIRLALIRRRSWTGVVFRIPNSIGPGQSSSSTASRRCSTWPTNLVPLTRRGTARTSSQACRRCRPSSSGQGGAGPHRSDRQRRARTSLRTPSGVMELSAIWVPLHLQMLDGGTSSRPASTASGAAIPAAERLLQAPGPGGGVLL